MPECYYPDDIHAAVMGGLLQVICKSLHGCNADMCQSEGSHPANGPCGSCSRFSETACHPLSLPGWQSEYLTLLGLFGSTIDSILLRILVPLLPMRGNSPQFMTPPPPPPAPSHKKECVLIWTPGFKPCHVQERRHQSKSRHCVDQYFRHRVDQYLHSPHRARLPTPTSPSLTSEHG